MTQQLLLKRFGQTFCGLALMIPLTLSSGCSQQSTQQASDPTTTEAAANTSANDQPSLAVVLGGPANDDSWNEAYLIAKSPI